MLTNMCKFTPDVTMLCYRWGSQRQQQLGGLIQIASGSVRTEQRRIGSPIGEQRRREDPPNTFWDLVGPIIGGNQC